MSYGLTANDWMDPNDAAAGVGAHDADGLLLAPGVGVPQVERSALIPVLFALPVGVSALSYAGDGVTFLSDAAFLILTALCAWFLAVELLAFGRRQGIGAILIYGGVLIWFCHDYGTSWFARDYRKFDPYFPNVKADTVARALFYHCLYVELMLVAFRVQALRAVDRAVVAVPEPADGRFYLYLVAAALLIGWSAFIPTKGLWPVSLVKGALWFLPGVGHVEFTVSRSGNMNYNWGGYFAQVIQVGQVGGILGAVYALLIAPTNLTRAFGWFTWGYWMSFSFQGDRRGEIAFMALPVLGVLFLLYHAEGDAERRRRNGRWLVGTVVAVAFMWYAVQRQTATREGKEDVSLFRVSGNSMFSEGLTMWAQIPGRTGYVYDTFPGELVLRPLPDTLWWFVTGPIPRAIWTTKPVEEFALRYSAMVSHDERGVESKGLIGTTVSTGAVGYWYFRYGPAGVIEGGLFVGWMMGVAERALRRATGDPMRLRRGDGGQPIKLMFALGFATFLFRSYRDLWWHNLYPMMIGGVVIWTLVRFVFGAARPGAAPGEPGFPVVMPSPDGPPLLS